MNGTQTGIAVTGSVGYGILDPTSIVYCGLVALACIFFYFITKSLSTRYMRRTANVDHEAAELNLAKWRDSQLKKIPLQGDK